MVNQELDYEIPIRPLVWAWLTFAFATLIAGFCFFSPLAMLLFVAVILIWINLYSTILHYSLDAEEFAKLPVVGPAFVRFQSHHFPKWINVIHRKPITHLVGELNPVAILNLASPFFILKLWKPSNLVTWAPAVLVAWGTLMLAGGYAMICHRWAHQPASTKPRLATILQRAHLALSPTKHWAHHALAANPGNSFVPNYDLSFGWSNALFNRVLKVLPSPRLWLTFIAITTFAQIPVLAALLRWLNY